MVLGYKAYPVVRKSGSSTFHDAESCKCSNEGLLE